MHTEVYSKFCQAVQIAIAAALLFAQAAFAQADAARIALVVGNASYAHIGALDNPTNDAGLIGGVLEKAGFDVTYLLNATQPELEAAVVALGRRLREAGPDTVGLFYFAGHGVQSKGKNFLLPVDAALSNEAELELVGLQADVILRQMGSAANRINVVILDACRNNPFAAVQGMEANGLAKMNPSPGTFLSYATGPGDVALDGLDQHSPFSAALAEAMSNPDQAIEQVFKDVRIKVVEQTRGIQTPWDTSLLTSDFVFFDSADVQQRNDAEATLWASVEGSDSPLALTRFLRAHPDGRFARIARQTLDAALTRIGTETSATRALRLSTTSPQASEAELFEAALASGALADYTAYLQRYPTGTYAELVALEIEARR